MLIFQPKTGSSQHYILNNPQLYEGRIETEYGYYDTACNNSEYDAQVVLENKKTYKIFTFNLFLEKLWQDKPNREEDENI